MDKSKCCELYFNWKHEESFSSQLENVLLNEITLLKFVNTTNTVECCLSRYISIFRSSRRKFYNLKIQLIINVNNMFL